MDPAASLKVAWPPIPGSGDFLDCSHIFRAPGFSQLWGTAGGVPQEHGQDRRGWMDKEEQRGKVIHTGHSHWEKKILCSLDRHSCGPDFNLHVSDYRAEALMLPSHVFFPTGLCVVPS